ncbi:MAG TPA: DUF2000 domain-containing protein [Mycobacteriales bacterium]|nr:DUF2000 domain-containing protein [Mycobacteriales bacterium]
MNVTSMVGYAPEEIRIEAATRSTRLKWVILVDAELPAGRAVNAAVCVATATGEAVRGLLGPDVKDARGVVHPGLPWGGCSILSASAEQLAQIRRKALEFPEIFLADMPEAAQSVRVYAEYLDRVANEDEMPYLAVSLIGPRKRIDRLVGRLPLLP